MPPPGTTPLSQLQVGAVAAAAEAKVVSKDRIAYGEYGALLADMAWRLLVNLAAYEIDGHLAAAAGTDRAVPATPPAPLPSALAAAAAASVPDFSPASRRDKLAPTSSTVAVTASSGGTRVAKRFLTQEDTPEAKPLTLTPEPQPESAGDPRGGVAPHRRGCQGD